MLVHGIKVEFNYNLLNIDKKEKKKRTEVWYLKEMKSLPLLPQKWRFLLERDMHGLCIYSELERQNNPNDKGKYKPKSIWSKIEESFSYSSYWRFQFLEGFLLGWWLKIFARDEELFWLRSFNKNENTSLIFVVSSSFFSRETL